MRRFLGRFSFLSAILLVAAFVYLSYAISKPVTSVQKPVLVRGTVRPAAALRLDAPFVRYVALHPGRPSAAGVPELPLDDQLTADNGAFELHADESDGTRFYVLARIETAREELWCETIALPPVRLRENGTWVEAATQEPLELVRITVDRSRRCD